MSDSSSNIAEVTQTQLTPASNFFTLAGITSALVSLVQPFSWMGDHSQKLVVFSKNTQNAFQDFRARNWLLTFIGGAVGLSILAKGIYIAATRAFYSEVDDKIAEINKALAEGKDQNAKASYINKSGLISQKFDEKEKGITYKLGKFSLSIFKIFSYRWKIGEIKYINEIKTDDISNKKVGVAKGRLIFSQNELDRIEEAIALDTYELPSSNVWDEVNNFGRDVITTALSLLGAVISAPTAIFNVNFFNPNKIYRSEINHFPFVKSWYQPTKLTKRKLAEGKAIGEPLVIEDTIDLQEQTKIDNQNDEIVKVINENIDLVGSLVKDAKKWNLYLDDATASQFTYELSTTANTTKPSLEDEMIKAACNSANDRFRAYKEINGIDKAKFLKEYIDDINGRTTKTVGRKMVA